MAGEATIRAVAVNAWQWAEEDKVKRIQLHEISYRNFRRGDFKHIEAEDLLKKVTAKRSGKDLSTETRIKEGDVVLPPSEDEGDKDITEVT